MLLPYLTVLGLAIDAVAYKIDKATCGDNSQFISRAMGDAFSMAQQAVRLIDTPGPQRSDNGNRLIELLFCGPNDDPITIDLGMARASLAGVGGMSWEDEDTDTRTQPGIENQVIIFCDMESRVSQNAKGHWVHKRHQQMLQEVVEEEIGSIPHCIGGLDVTLAVTWNLDSTWRAVNSGGATAERKEYHASEITLCPWFVEWAKFQKYKTYSDLGFKSGLATVVIPRMGRNTEFDKTTLLDKVLLHEMTHTNAGKKTEDVKVGSYGPYGWKNALGLAKNPGDGPKNQAQNNADTLALFASAVRLLNQDPPKYIADDGSLLDSSPLKRRDELPRELELPTTPVAFETFITMIKEKQARETAA